MKSVAVIGSLNIDFVTRTSRLPAAGETFAAKSFDTGFGGKGANQAVASARLAGQDVKVRMIGNVGADSFGADYIAALEKEEIDVAGVTQLPGQQTGVTNIIVEEATGENRILLVANANHAFSPMYDEKWDLIPSEGDVVVFQLEIPLDVALHNIQKAQEKGKHVILNPAPAVPLPQSVYQHVDTLIMNQTEASILSGSPDANSGDRGALFEILQQFLKLGVKEAVIMTLGERGLIYSMPSGHHGFIAAEKVQVVDTTAAGDTFVGAYAVRRARQIDCPFDHESALEFATAAASKTVEKAGAMAAIPFLRDLHLTDGRWVKP